MKRRSFLFASISSSMVGTIGAAANFVFFPNSVMNADENIGDSASLENKKAYNIQALKERYEIPTEEFARNLFEAMHLESSLYFGGGAMAASSISSVLNSRKPISSMELIARSANVTLATALPFMASPAVITLAELVRDSSLTDTKVLITNFGMSERMAKFFVNNYTTFLEKKVRNGAFAGNVLLEFLELDNTNRSPEVESNPPSPVSS